MHTLIHANASFLAAWVLTSMGVVALALLAERWLKTSAASRHVLLFGALLMPWVLPGWRWAVEGWREAPVPGTSSIVGAWEPIAAASRQPPAAGRDVACALVSLWAAGAILALLRTARDAQRWREAVRRAVPVSGRAMPVDHPVELSDACREPAVAGILNPTILLPAGPYLDALTDEELESVLTHEVEHVRRHDNLRALLVQLVCTVFWFSPAHRAARRRLVELRERACDEAVLSRGCEPDSYLSALAKSCHSSFQSSAVASMSRLQFRERMESIMTFEPQSPRRLSWTMRVALVAVAGVVATAFAFFAPSPSLFASSPQPGGDFSADVWVRPAADGRYVATIKLDAPDGPFTTVAVMQAVPDQRVVTSTHGGRTYRVVMHTNSDASGTAEIEVRQGDEVVWSATRTFAAPPAVPRSAAGERYARVNDKMKPPKPIHRVEPLYPDAAKREGIFGVVILEAMINERGTVDDVVVLKGLPQGLDAAAADAVRQWRFEPATIDGKPVPVVFNLTIRFKLNE